MARLGLLIPVLLLAGCVTEDTAPRRPRMDTVIQQSAPTGFGEAPTPTPSAPPRTARPPAARTARATPVTTAPHAQTCPAALDELCGPLLIFYKAYSRMPQTLAELRQFQEFQHLGEFKCPLSGHPYTYFPEGVRLADEELLREGRPSVKVAKFVLVTDPTPVHDGVRYAIFILRPEGSDDIQARVGILPDGLSP